MRTYTNALVGGLGAVTALAVLSLTAFEDRVAGMRATAQPADDPRVPSAKIAPTRDPEVTARRAAAWTPERTSAAKPLLLPQLDSMKPSRNKSRLPPLPGAGATGRSRAAPVPFSGNVGNFPLTLAGRLFFSKDDGDYSCSAQFISRRVILTAAHCLRNRYTGDFYDDFGFALQYDRGRYSRMYSWECVTTLRGWVIDEEVKHRWDIGMIYASANSINGSFGWEYGWTVQDYPKATMIGYPADILGGRVIQINSGPLAMLDDDEIIVGMKHNNPKNGEGGSGGAWLDRISANSGEANYVISVTSFGFNDDPTTTYGPRFTEDNFKPLLEHASSGCN